MFSAAIRVLSRAAAIQLEEVAAAHPRPPRSILKGKERAIPIRRDFRSELEQAPTTTDLGEHSGTEGKWRERYATPISSVAADSNRKPGLQENLESLTSELSVETTNSTAGPSRLPPQAEAHRQTAHAAHVSSEADHGQSTPKVVTEIDRTPRPEPVASRSSRPTGMPEMVEPAVAVEPTVSVDPPTSKSSKDAAPAPGAVETKGPQEAVTSAEKIAPKSTVPEPIVEEDIAPINDTPASIAEEAEDTPVVLRASKVPSSRIGRLFHYGSLAASMSWGAASEGLRRTAGGTPSGGSVFMSDANIRRLVATLGRMRGAALKLGQFMSIQDNHMLPPEIEQVLQQVQAHANYMPDWQMEKVMSTEFGSDWENMFSSFERVPIASASIGQVHKATMASTGLPVAIKIQFPGIASSISSDLSNLSILLRSSALLPKGLYLQNTIAVMKRELEDECDYIREAESGRRFHRLLKDYDYFKVPQVVDEASTSKVLTVEWMAGKPLSRVRGLSQKDRDQLGENILRLCLLELFEFRFMQTDPNWANFLYDTSAHKLGLIDFGASREYSKEFMDGWYRLLMSAVKGDRETMKIESENLGYLTGEENEMMVKAHLDSMALVASPFCHRGPYEFAQQTITASVRSLIPIMLAHRLTPPPQETYSLNRKLSGAFLMCAKLESRVDCAKLWDEVVGSYKQGPE